MADIARDRRRWVVLGVLMVSFLLTILDATIINVAFRALADPVHGLGAGPGELEWVVNAFTLVYAGLLLAWGVLGDRYGYRTILLVGLAIFGVASVLAAFSGSGVELVIWRAVMGFGAAAIPPTTLAIISQVFDAEERPKAIGFWVSSAGIAAMLAPVLGGILLQFFWWGSVFLINGPIVLAAFIATLLLVPQNPPQQARRLDPLGVLLSMAWSVLLVFGVIEAGGARSLLEPQVYLPIAAGLVLLAVFVAVELRVQQPALDLRLISDRRVIGALVAVGLAFFINFGSPFFLIFYLQSVLEVSPLMTALAILPLALALAVFSPRSAALVRRYGARTVLLGGIGLLALSSAAFALLDTDSPLWPVFVIDFLVGLAMANVMPPATAMVMSGIPPERAGVGSALTNMSRSIGGALGIAVIGSVLTVRYRDEVSGALGALPQAARAGAAESIEMTRAAAGTLGPDAGARLLAGAQESFVAAMRFTTLGSAILGVLAMVAVAVLLPGGKPPAPAAATSTDTAPAADTEPDDTETADTAQARD